MGIESDVTGGTIWIWTHGRVNNQWRIESGIHWAGRWKLPPDLLFRIAGKKLVGIRRPVLRQLLPSRNASLWVCLFLELLPLFYGSKGVQKENHNFGGSPTKGETICVLKIRKGLGQTAGSLTKVPLRCMFLTSHVQNTSGKTRANMSSEIASEKTKHILMSATEQMHSHLLKGPGNKKANLLESSLNMDQKENTKI